MGRPSVHVLSVGTHAKAPIGFILHIAVKNEFGDWRDRLSG